MTFPVYPEDVSGNVHAAEMEERLEVVMISRDMRSRLRIPERREHRFSVH